MKSKIIFNLTILSCIGAFIAAQGPVVGTTAKIMNAGHIKTISFTSEKLSLLEICNDTSEPVQIFKSLDDYYAGLTVEPQSTHQFGLIACDKNDEDKEIKLFLSHPAYRHYICIAVTVRHMDSENESTLTIGDLEKHSVSLLISKLFQEA